MEIKIKEFRVTEFSEKKLFGTKKTKHSSTIINQLKLNDDCIDYRYWLNDIDIPEIFIIRISNIKAVFYNKEKDCFTIFYDWDKNDYYEMYNLGVIDEEDKISYNEITEEDLKYEMLEIDNIYDIDFFEYFKNVRIDVKSNEDGLNKETKKYEDVMATQYPMVAKMNKGRSVKILERRFEKIE